MTEQDYKLAKTNTARQIIAIVDIKKSIEKCIKSLDIENFVSIECFYGYKQELESRVQSLNINLTRLISNVRFYQKCIRHRLPNIDDTDFDAIDCY